MTPSKRLIQASASMLVLLFAAGLLVGGVGIYYVTFMQVNSLNTQVSNLQSQVSALRGFQNATYQTINIQQNGTSLENLYNDVRESVVLIQGDISGGGIQASGFVYTFADRTVILTNYHVVQSTSNLSVTFSDGNGYGATVLGTDPYSDLAVVSVNGAPAT